MAARYIINLPEQERLGSEDLLARKRLSQLKAQRIQILLKADEGLTDSEVAEEVGVGTATVERVRKRAVLEGVAAALDRRAQVGISRPPALDGRAKAHLSTLACSDPPRASRGGRWRRSATSWSSFGSWTPSAGRRFIVANNEVKPRAVKRFCIAPEHSGAFVHTMEDVLVGKRGDRMKCLL